MPQALVAGLQTWSQPHDRPQSSSPHAWSPLQPTSHEPVPHRMLGQAFSPLQVTSQSPPALQSISLHAPVAHVIWHEKPGGQTTRPHGLPTVHAIVQVRSSRSHAVHPAGQPLLGGGATIVRSAQNPREHMRSASQSASLLHANAVDRRLTVQLGVASAASPATTSVAATIASRAPGLGDVVPAVTGPRRS